MMSLFLLANKKIRNFFLDGVGLCRHSLVEVDHALLLDCGLLFTAPYGSPAEF